MQLDKTIKPELFVSQDTMRPHLCQVYLDTQYHHVAATDGHRMIVAPVRECSLDDAGFISADALKAARKLARAGDALEVHANGSLSLADGSVLPRQREHADTKFPPYRRVLSGSVSQPPRASVGVSAKYLASVFAAIGDKRVTMHVRGDLDPIEFEAPSEHGTVRILIMPMKL